MHFKILIVNNSFFFFPNLGVLNHFEQYFCCVKKSSLGTILFVLQKIIQTKINNLNSKNTYKQNGIIRININITFILTIFWNLNCKHIHFLIRLHFKYVNCKVKYNLLEFKKKINVYIIYHTKYRNSHHCIRFGSILILIKNVIFVSFFLQKSLIFYHSYYISTRK